MNNEEKINLVKRVMYGISIVKDQKCSLCNCKTDHIVQINNVNICKSCLDEIFTQLDFIKNINVDIEKLNCNLSEYCDGLGVYEFYRLFKVDREDNISDI